VDHNFEAFRDMLWGSSDGSHKRVRDIDDSHIVNILNWIADHPKSYPPSLYGLFEQEAQLRQLALFVSNQPYPSKQNGRWTMANIDVDLTEEI
jgi:hypothetical protein